MLYPHHENDIIPVVLQKPDDHWTLAVAFHAGHRFTDIEWHAYPPTATASAIRGCEAFHLVDLGMTANHVIAMPILYHHA